MISLVAYYVVYDKVEWTIAEVTTSEVFFVLMQGGSSGSGEATT